VSLFAVELSHPDERGRLAAWLQLAGVASAGLLISQVSRFLPWWQVPLRSLVLQSAVLTGLAWLAAAGVTLGLYALCDYLFFQDWGAGEIGPAVLRTAATAVWFVPAIVLASTFHPGALVAALVLVHNVTRLLYWQWRLSARSEEQPPVEADSLFAAAQVRSPLLARRLASRLLVAACVEASAVALLLHDYGLARALFYAGTAMVTMLVMAEFDYRAETGSSIWRAGVGLVLSLLLAEGLTIGSLAPRARGGSASQGSGKGTAAASEPAGKIPGVPRPLPSPTGESFPADSFPGVILWPEIQPVPTLIAPMPHGHGGAHMAQPLGIPFSGEYWMYRWPYARPPQNSFRKRGNPAALSFRTTDHRPLQMEAHHKLDQAIGIRCCSQIQVAIRNADRQPGALALELVLINNEEWPVRRQSLGSAAVAPIGGDAKSGLGVVETLQFAVPADPALDEFNEFQVIFLRDKLRMEVSAKIAIERFVLIPR
jgi:hypothetical protein